MTNRVVVSEVLADTLSCLLIEKANMDREFSEYLDKHNMSAEHLDTPEWKTYQAMLKEYSTIEDKITKAKYYLGMYNGRT